MIQVNQDAVEWQNSFSPSDKTAKYDRQLRLWGSHGQASLEQARICLINASIVGTETLKNMVLPGIGFFTIIDEGYVTEEDTKTNFFLPFETIGQNRAKVASQYLCELNPDVVGDYLEENIDRILDNKPEYLKTFNIVITSNLKENVMKKLTQYLWNENIPVMILKSIGYVGSIRVIVPEHIVIEAHPDNELPDLRLDQPFEELKAHCNAIDLKTISDQDHSHIPYLIILYKYLEDWKAENNGQIPRNYKEKEKFKELVRSGILKNEENVPKFEENFEEALKNVNNSITQTKIPEEIHKLFQDEKCLNLNSNSQNFWIILRAIKEFSENEGQGQLPLRGTIPDMFSDSDKFIALQNIYRTKSQNDVDIVMSRVERLLINIDKSYDCINEKLVKMFCKNAHFLKIIKYRSIKEEYDPQSTRLGLLLEQNTDDGALLYLILRGLENYYSEYNKYPGTVGGVGDEPIDSDCNLLKRIINKILSDYGINYNLNEDFIYEICRYSSTEFHTISAFLGGCAAHECIKLLTNQFVPINNTLIYNGIKQMTTVFEF